MSRIQNKRSFMPEVKYSVTQLGATIKGFQTYPGGLDLITPSLELHPGALRAAQNFECAINGGYARIAGYERADGRPSPSLAGFVIVQVVSFTNVPVVGDAITQAVSGATGVVAAVSTTAPSPYMIVTKVVGVFDATHTITKSGPTTIGTATTTTVGLTSLLLAQYTANAADIYRADITAVPGSGSILGVMYMHLTSGDALYAFRPNAGNTKVELYKATAGGWTLVPFFNVVEFTAGGGGGTVGPLDGGTLTQGANSATIQRVMWRSGAWSGTAVGGFVVTNPAPGNFVAGAATATGGFTVTLSGAQTPIVLATGGRFEIDNGNFTGRATNDRAYGADGVNKAFEFDGTTLSPITTGLNPDNPLHVTVHKGYLFLSIGSSAMFSAAGLPFKWSAVDGAGEIAVGDNVTNMLTLPGNQATATLAIFQTSNTSFLYGNAASTWQLVTYNTGVGARAYSAQNLFDMFSFDDFGIMTLQTSLNFGNFSASAITRNILPFLVPERSNLVASGISRTKGQYRIFFRDGYGLLATTSNQTYLGVTTVLYPNPVTCTVNDKTASGNEVNYFGSTNGFVYQNDVGTSFDGGEIYAYITTAWDPIKSPRMRKRFRAISIEVQGTGYAAFNFSYSLSYSSALVNQPAPVPTASPFASAPTWDIFTWDMFIWDGVTLSPTDVDMTGTSENVQITIQSATAYIPAYQVNSIIYHYTPRRGIRV